MASGSDPPRGPCGRRGRPARRGAPAGAGADSQVDLRRRDGCRRRLCLRLDEDGCRQRQHARGRRRGRRAGRGRGGLSLDHAADHRGDPEADRQAGPVPRPHPLARGPLAGRRRVPEGVSRRRPGVDRVHPAAHGEGGAGRPSGDDRVGTQERETLPGRDSRRGRRRTARPSTTRPESATRIRSRISRSPWTRSAESFR